MANPNTFAADLAGKLALFLGPVAEAMERMIAALVRGLRRFLLRLLGGVPAEAAQKAAVTPVERPRVDLTRAPARRGREVEPPAPRPVVQVVEAPPLPPPPRPKAEEGRWSDRTVRQCLQRMADGERPFGHMLRKLPLDVAAWISGMDIQDAADLARSNGTTLKAAFEAWKNPPGPGPEAEAGPRPAATPEAAAAPEPPCGGPRP